VVKAAEISGSNTENHFLVEINYAFEASLRANQKEHRPIAREEPHTAQEEIQTKERIVTLPRALAQFFDFRPYSLHCWSSP
jgi:hypothetical protein